METKINNNCRIEGKNVISYTTHVATIDGRNLIIHGHWSATTSRHINEVANMYGLNKVSGPKPEGSDGMDILRLVGTVAKMGELFSRDTQDRNNWKARMMKAGLGEMVIFPDDWDTLSEDEKERRLNEALAELK